jgi:hypothetical protein
VGEDFEEGLDYSLFSKSALFFNKIGTIGI